MNRFFTLVVTLISLSLTGCDISHGIASHAKLTGLVNIGCIDNTLKQMPIVTHIEMAQDSDSAHWMYEVNGAPVILNIGLSPNDLHYRNGLLAFGKPPPEKDVLTVQAALPKIDGTLFNQCKLQAKSPLQMQIYK
ncbi:MAG: hypothetical protein WBQ60_02490 [Asticcacaulis sp.]